MKIKFNIYKFPDKVGWLGWFDVFKIDFENQTEPDERYFLGLDYKLHYENDISGTKEYDVADWWK